MRRMFSENQIKNIVNQGIESGEVKSFSKCPFCVASGNVSDGENVWGLDVVVLKPQGSEKSIFINANDGNYIEIQCLEIPKVIINDVTIEGASLTIVLKEFDGSVIYEGDM